MDDSMNSDGAESGTSETNDTSFESDTESVCLETLKTELEDCLGNLLSAGTFALFEHLPNPVNPGLYVKGVGTIGLPLSDRDAEAIKEASVEPELAANCIETRNPAWEHFVDVAISKVTSDLGIEGSVRAELKGMHLYDKSSKFTYHKGDFKKAPATFGALAICLPSKHEGGEMHVSHLGQSKTCQTAQYSAYDSSLMAWYYDTTIERESVSSGQQLMLFYSLHYEGRANGSASKAIEKSANLRGLIASWTGTYERNGEQEVIAYRLEHPTTAALRYSVLEGHDQKVVQYLKEACLVNGCYLYLASLERRVEGSTEEYDDYYDWRRDDEEHRSIIEVDSVTVELTTVANLNGTVLGHDIEIKEEAIIQDGLFERDPDEEAHEDSFATHYYRETAAIIVARGARIPFFLGPVRNHESNKEKKNQCIKNWLLDLSRDPDGIDAKQQAQSDLFQACQIVINDTKKFFEQSNARFEFDIPWSSEVMELVCINASRWGQSLYLDILDLDFSKMPMPYLESPFIFPSLGKTLADSGFGSLEPKLSASINRVSAFHVRCIIIDHIHKGFEGFNSLPKSLRSSNGNLSTVAEAKSEVPISEEPGNTELLTWIKSRYEEALTQCEMRYSDDGLRLIKLAQTLGSEFLLNKIVPALKKHAASSSLLMAFIMELTKTADDGGIPYDVALKAFRFVLPDMVEYFSLQPSQPAGYKRVKTGSEIYQEVVDRASPRPSLSGGSFQDSLNLAFVLYRCSKLGLTSELDQIISKILTESHTVGVELFDQVIIPFFKILVKFLVDQEAHLTEPRFRLLFQQGLAIYQDRYVKPEPTKPTDWTRPARGCGCNDCNELDWFLSAPHSQTGRFTKVQKMRKHFEQRLTRDYKDYEFNTDRNGSPHTLVITKTRNVTQFKRDLDEWKRRGKWAIQNIQSMGVEPLRKLLGDQFDAIMGLKSVQKGARNGFLNDMAQEPADDIEVISID